MTPFSDILTTRKLTLAQVAARWEVDLANLTSWAAGTEKLPEGWMERLNRTFTTLERDPLMEPEIQAITAWQTHLFSPRPKIGPPAQTPLALALLARGISQSELSRCWGRSGVNSSTCSRWAAGVRSLPPRWPEHLNQALLKCRSTELSATEIVAIATWQTALNPKPRYRP